MKIIKLKRLSLLNFKGLREMEIDFQSHITEIEGRNGSGKTTIFDAFTWALFGKDSQDRKAFDIKTLDGNGQPIPKLPHEVTVVLEVDGTDITLCRRYKEKWTKRRGSVDEVFTGHEEERLYNGVPCNVNEWNAKIAEICKEQVFKFITSPSYFVSQKPAEQREMLIRMAGGISDAEVANGNDEFAELLKQITGKTFEEYKREIAAKKRPIKSELDSIPDRIDERKRDAVDTTDYGQAETALQVAQKQLAEIESQIEDNSQKANAKTKQILGLSEKVAKIRQQQQTIRFDTTQEILADYHKMVNERNSLEAKLNTLANNKDDLESQIDFAKDKIDKASLARTEKIAEWKQINSEKLVFDENDFVCPTCKRTLEADEIYAKQKEMQSNFNERKAERLKQNVQEGQSIRAIIDKWSKVYDENQAKVEALGAEIDKIKKSEIYTKEIVKPDTTNADLVAGKKEEYVSLSAKSAELLSQIDKLKNSSTADNSELKERKQALLAEIDGYKTQLARKEYAEQNKKRIAELESTMRSLSDELAQLEKTEYVMQQFQKAKIEMVERKINSMFGIVKFKMFDTQINGGEVETCEATVDGVPYSSLNNAGRINAGLDIIRTICKFVGVSAPIIIDNAESVVKLLNTDSQQVRLYVADTDLTIRK